jgi:hypothetical protein
MVNFRDFLGQLGLVKNPALLSCCIFSTSILYFAGDLFDCPDWISKVTGAVMLLLSLLVYLIGIRFYIAAFLKLPSAIQEQIFLQEARAAITHHNRSGAKPKWKKRAGE